MTTTTPELSAAQRAAGERIDGLDLEPIAFKLMHPEPGETAMTLTEADQLVAAYRRFLKLCAWYPQESIVPSKAVDEVWHTHILDTAKYDDDSHTVFGYLLHHFPYFGLRGADDEAALHGAYEHTSELFRLHFGTGLSGESHCNNGQDDDGNNDPRATATTCANDGDTEGEEGTGCISSQAGQACSTSCEAGGNQCSASGCHNRAARHCGERPRPERAAA